jgi:phosphoketolase
MVANTYLEGTYSEIYPSITQAAEGLRRLCRQFYVIDWVPSLGSKATHVQQHFRDKLIEHRIDVSRSNA